MNEKIDSRFAGVGNLYAIDSSGAVHVSQQGSRTNSAAIDKVSRHDGPSLLYVIEIKAIVRRSASIEGERTPE